MAAGDSRDSLEKALQDLLDRQAIRDCLLRYTRGADRHDEELMRSAFWPDAKIAYRQLMPIHLMPLSREDFIAMVNSEHGRWEQNQHHITNQTIDLEGDTAHVESYVINFLFGSDRVTGKHTIGSGRYIERYERRKGQWRILVREYIADAIFTASATKTVDLCDPNIPLRGRRDRSDLSYVRPLVALD